MPERSARTPSTPRVPPLSPLETGALKPSPSGASRARLLSVHAHGIPHFQDFHYKLALEEATKDEEENIGAGETLTHIQCINKKTQKL